LTGALNILVLGRLRLGGEGGKNGLYNKALWAKKKNNLGHWGNGGARPFVVAKTLGEGKSIKRGGARKDNESKGNGKKGVLTPRGKGAEAKMRGTRFGQESFAGGGEKRFCLACL